MHIHIYSVQLGVRSASIKDLRRGYDQKGASTLYTPMPVEQMQGRHVTAVAAGGRGNDGGHTAFVVRGEVGDELWMCGHGRWGQLGLLKRAVLARGTACGSRLPFSLGHGGGRWAALWARRWAALWVPGRGYPRLGPVSP